MLREGALAVITVLSKLQLQHLHVVLAGDKNVLARRELGALKQHYEDVMRFKGKV